MSIVMTLLKAAAELNGVAKKHGHTWRDFDPKQIQMAMKIEKEHTDDPEVMKTIGADHLEENPRAYSDPFYQKEIKKEEKQAGAYALGKSARRLV